MVSRRRFEDMALIPERYRWRRVTPKQHDGADSISQAIAPRPQLSAADNAALLRTQDLVVVIDGPAILSEAGVADSAELVKLLERGQRRFGYAADVVFAPSQFAVPRSRTVRVRVAADGVALTVVLIELAGAYPSNWPLVMVSSHPPGASSQDRISAWLHAKDFFQAH